VILDIVKYGNPILSRRAEHISDFGGPLDKLVDDMFETMYAASGVGLAAAQVGISTQLFVMDCSDATRKTTKIALINPIIELEEGEQIDSEGCLSLPGFSFEITRPEHVIVRGNDVNGTDIRLEVVGLEARCVVHEIHHLEGKLLVSLVSPLKRDIIERRIKRLNREGRW